MIWIGEHLCETEIVIHLQWFDPASNAKIVISSFKSGDQLQKLQMPYWTTIFKLVCHIIPDKLAFASFQYPGRYFGINGQHVTCCDLSVFLFNKVYSINSSVVSLKSPTGSSVPAVDFSTFIDSLILYQGRRWKAESFWWHSKAQYITMQTLNNTNDGLRIEFKQDVVEKGNSKLVRCAKAQKLEKSTIPEKIRFGTRDELLGHLSV